MKKKTLAQTEAFYKEALREQAREYFDAWKGLREWWTFGVDAKHEEGESEWHDGYIEGWIAARQVLERKMNITFDDGIIWKCPNCKERITRGQHAVGGEYYCVAPE